MAITEIVKNPNENKKRRVSKKSKISWRKHTDVKDVDAFLDEKRLDERLGAPFSERPDHELFQVDTAPDSSSQVIDVSLTKSLKRKAIQSKLPKCYQVLKSHSAVPDPISKRNRVRSKAERHPLVTKLNEDRLKLGILKKKEMVQIKNQAIARAKKAIKPKRQDVTSDLWGDDAKIPQNPYGEDGEWLNQLTLMHTLKNTRSMQRSIPNSIHKKLSVVSAVEPPHPGTSYNPSFEDHQALLHEVAESEAKIMKEERHLHRVTSKMFSRVSGETNHNNWMREMSEGLPEKDVKKEDDSEDDGDYKAINPPAKNAKKPLKKRRKLKEARAEEVVRKKVKEERKKHSDVHRLTVLQKEIGTVDKKIDMLRSKREKVKGFKALETRQLSKTKFQEADLEFNMCEDIAGNLRSLKPEGSLMCDRYKSLQKRNVVAPTQGQQNAKRGKVKKFERSTHKMGWEPKGF